MNLTRRAFIGTMIVGSSGIAAGADEWTALFDGHSLEGWRPSENKGLWKVVEGMLAQNTQLPHHLGHVW